MGGGTIKQVFLIEYVEDIDSAISLDTGERDQSTFIALRPTVAWELECRGIPFKNILSYGGGKERWDKTIENFAILDEVIAKIDYGIEDFVRVKTFKPAMSSYYYLKITLDVITTKILLIQTIISREKPDEIVIYYHSSPKIESFFPFSEEESVFSYLLDLEGWNLPVRIIRPDMQYKQSPDPCQAPKKSFFVRNATSLVKRNNFLSNLLFGPAFIFKHFGITESVIAIMRSFTPFTRNPVIIYGNGYNWDYSLPEFFKAGICPVYRLLDDSSDTEKSTSLSEIYEEIIKICKNSEKIRYHAVVSGIDSSPILFEKIASIVSRACISGEKEYERSLAIFKRTRVRCLLVSTQASHLDRAVIQAARDLKIRVISWQHGGAGFCYHPIMYHAEFFGSDIHLVFGEGVADSYRKTSELLSLEQTRKFIATGSSWLDRESEKIKSSGPQKSKNSGSIVYITEKFQFNLYYNSTTFDSTEICDHFWKVQREILDFAATYPGTPFVFKFHPADNEGEPVRSYAKKHALNNVQFIVQEKRIEDLIPDSRVIIIDFVSTSVLESVLTDKPVFIYTGMFRMDDAPVSLLKRRAFLYNSFPELLESLEKFLLIGSEAFAQEYGVDYHDTEFIRSFGTHLHNGGSSRHAAAEIKTHVFSE